jgi:transposase
LWRILDFYVSKELEKQDFSKEPIKTLSVDEIARKKHHVYLTNFLDVEREKVVHIADGKDAETFLSFKERYTEKNGDPTDIESVCKTRLDELMEYDHLDTVQAYELVLEFKKMFDYKKPFYAAEYFKRWYEKVMKSNIPEMIKAVKTLLNHIEGILLYIKTNISNGKIEGMKFKLRGFTKRAFGFKRLKNLKITIFIAPGKLNLTLD